jgi:hypothetical protein
MKRLGLILGATLLLAVAASPVSAASKAGCSAGTSGWTEASIELAASTIWDSILDQSPFPNGIPDLEAALGGLDRNGDGDLCLKRIWGDDLNPKSNWFGVIANYLRDNTAAATDS